MHTSALERLMSKLREAGVGFVVEDDCVLVPKPKNAGFAVRFEETEDGFVVHYDGWREAFSCEMRAVDCFVFGLSDRCRLKVFRRGSEAYRWTVQYFADGQWLEGSTLGTCAAELWQERSVEYKQNAVLKHAGA
jgi:hypothetical protein